MGDSWLQKLPDHVWGKSELSLTALHSPAVASVLNGSFGDSQTYKDNYASEQGSVYCPTDVRCSPRGRRWVLPRSATNNMPSNRPPLKDVSILLWPLTLLWCHNGRNGVSNNRRLGCLFNCSFKLRSKKTSKLRVTGLCEENSPVTGEFPAPRASNAENVSIWWRHHELTKIN